MQVIAEAIFDLAESSSLVNLRIYKPEMNQEYNAWMCLLEIDAPFEIAEKVSGESSLQALILTIKVASAILYGSDLYKQRKLGVHGEFGGNLLILLSQKGESESRRLRRARLR